MGNGGWGAEGEVGIKGKVEVEGPLASHRNHIEYTSSSMSLTDKDIDH